MRGQGSRRSYAQILVKTEKVVDVHPGLDVIYPHNEKVQKFSD